MACQGDGIVLEELRSTTILAVKSGPVVAMAGDGQVTLGDKVLKSGARKIRRIGGEKILAGFAGSAADGLALLECLEGQLSAHGGNLKRAAVELAKEWRTDRRLRRLEALLLVADEKDLLVVSGSGEVIEPDDGIAGIGSGGALAVAAARALSRRTRLPPDDIAREALVIASEICVYTNGNIVLEVI